MRTKLIVLTICTLIFSVTSLSMAETEENKSEKELKLESEILALQLELAALKEQHLKEIASLRSKVNQLAAALNINATETKAKPKESVAPINIPAQSGGYQAQGRQGGSFQTFNPNISVIPDFLTGYVKQGDESADDTLMREIEIGFDGAVDTWGRYDLFLALHSHPGLEVGEDHDHGHGHGEEGEEAGLEVEIEEAYFTFLTLPSDLQLRVGKFRNRIGKTNPFHLHSIPWVDYPLAVQRYLGEEGLGGTGASVSWLTPLPQYTEFTYEVFKAGGEGASGLFDEEADDYSHLFHLNTFFDITDNATFEIGGTSVVTPASEEFGGDENWLNSVDFTFKWSPSGDGTFRRLEWRTEIFGLRKTIGLHHEEEDDHHHEEDLMLLARSLDDEEEEHHDEEELSREDFFGLYSSLAYRFNKRFDLGFRYDYAEGPFDPDLSETNYSIYLTVWQSEYAYWRLGWLRSEIDLDGITGDPANKLFLQFNISLGPHPAHKY